MGGNAERVVFACLGEKQRRETNLTGNIVRKVPSVLGQLTEDVLSGEMFTHFERLIG